MLDNILDSDIGNDQYVLLAWPFPLVCHVCEMPLQKLAKDSSNLMQDFMKDLEQRMIACFRLLAHILFYDFESVYFT